MEGAPTGAAYLVAPATHENLEAMQSPQERTLALQAPARLRERLPDIAGESDAITKSLLQPGTGWPLGHAGFCRPIEIPHLANRPSFMVLDTTPILHRT